MPNSSPESCHPSIFPFLNVPPAVSVPNSHTVEVLHFIQILKHSNTIARKLHSSITFDTSILYQIVDQLISGTSFTNEQCTAYFHIQQSLEEFHRTLDNSLQETLEVHLPYAVDFQLLGLDATRYSLLDPNKKVPLHEQYELLYFELLEGYSTVEEFITSAQKLLKRL